MGNNFRVQFSHSEKGGRKCGVNYGCLWQSQNLLISYILLWETPRNMLAKESFGPESNEKLVTKLGTHIQPSSTRGSEGKKEMKKHGQS